MDKDRKSASCKQAVIWYNHCAMPHQTPIDISNMPELLRIAEEVAATKTPRELKRENRTVAVIMPTVKSTAKKKKAIDTALALAGAWSDLPSDHLEEELDHIRHASKPTPPIEL